MAAIAGKKALPWHPLQPDTPKPVPDPASCTAQIPTEDIQSLVKATGTPASPVPPSRSQALEKTT